MADNSQWDTPKSLKGHIFHGLNLNKEQKAFRDAIWNPENKIVFCDSV